MLCACDFILPQNIILCLQPRQCLLAILGQIRLTMRRDSIRKEPGLPLFVLFFSLVGFLALPLFELLFQFCSFIELFAFDCGGDGGPEAL